MRAFTIGLAVALFAATPTAAKPSAAPAVLLRTGLTNRDPKRVDPKPAKPATTANATTTNVITATPAMWVVHGPRGTAYLLGSIHALPKNIDWQTPEIAAAMKRADTFVFEIPMDTESRTQLTQMFQSNGFLPVEVSLPSYFDRQMRDNYRHVIFLTHADPTNIVYMRPWLAAMALQGAADGETGLIAAEGVDNKVYAQAVARGVKNFRALETGEFQFRLLMGDGNINEEMTRLRRTFATIIASHKDIISGLLAAWEKGDTTALATYGAGSSGMSPEYRKAFLEDRNRRWVPQIEAMLNEKHTYFITVGAGHLVGNTGVPNLLREKGYRVDGPDMIASASSSSLRALR
ncbi:MAG TPA: TraB/GumN family protein [Rhizomicrobium sp.]|nr:TraB/GumN family protein [Rhizomicrobium sp.]